MPISPEFVLEMSDVVVVISREPSVWPLCATRFGKVYTQSFFVDSEEDDAVARHLESYGEHGALKGPSLDIMHYQRTGEIVERRRPGMTMIWLENPWLTKGETNG